ncbi:OmpH family outer membrane protein [Dongshaea marina]|uniref:OmpH family outer membrane protein n=1 Tax=Dongshaea marina TaxID=2047966 RepID=UPI000D3EC9E6|nr:OmpH family outer membrane protein [Dongshaea marina]
MNRFIKIAGLSVALMAAGISSAYAAAAQKIGVVNVAEVLQALPQQQQINQMMQKKFSARQQELQKLGQKIQGILAKQKKDKDFMSSDEMAKLSRQVTELKSQFDLKRQLLQQDEQRTFADARNKLLVTIQQAVKTVAQKQQLALVLQAPAVAYTTPDMDISKQVVEQLNKSK